MQRSKIDKKRRKNVSLLLDAKSQIGSQLQEVHPSQWLGQNVYSIICGGYLSCFYLPIRDQFPNVVILNADMLHSRMPEVVLGENGRSVVIAVDGCGTSGEEVDLIQ